MVKREVSIDIAFELRTIIPLHTGFGAKQDADSRGELPPTVCNSLISWGLVGTSFVDDLLGSVYAGRASACGHTILHLAVEISACRATEKSPVYGAHSVSLGPSIRLSLNTVARITILHGDSCLIDHYKLAVQLYIFRHADRSSTGIAGVPRLGRLGR